MTRPFHYVQYFRKDIPGALLCLSFLIKPFYLLPSGFFQFGDLFLMVALVGMMIREKTDFRIERVDLILGLFVVCVVVINSIYFAICGTSDFVIQTIYYIYNFLAVILFRKEITEFEFLNAFTNVLRINIILQALIFVLHLGRWYGGMPGEATRYMGTFNDPNQLSFFIFCCYVFIQIAHQKVETKTHLTDDALAIFVIFQTASTGMLLGFFLVFIPKVLSRLCMLLKTATLNKAVVIGASVISVVILIGSQFVPSTSSEKSAFVFERVQQKISKVIGTKNGNTDFQDSIIADRQLDKLILYPEKMLYGAGQGDFYRFDRAISANEVHSSFPGMLFYYGIGPFIVLLYWVYRNFASGSNSPYVLLCYLAYFAETCTLTNQRQPLFWMIIAFASLKSVKSDGQGMAVTEFDSHLFNTTPGKSNVRSDAHEI